MLEPYDSSDESVESVDSYDSEEYSSEETSSSSSSEVPAELTRGFFVEFSLVCTDSQDQCEEFPIVVVFETEEEYHEHQNDCSELIDLFTDAVGKYHPGWSYGDEWEEVKIYGTEPPQNHVPRVSLHLL